MSTTKLTKKQKKSLAFRERRTHPPRKAVHGKHSSLEHNSLPAMEDQDAFDNEGIELEAKANVRMDMARSGQNGGADLSKGKKRKAEGVEEHEEAPRPKKRSKKRVEVGEEVGDEENVGKSKHQRFILFVGNLKYTTTREGIQAHFAECDPPPAVRLLTPKVFSSAKSSTKSKGCAFLEFAHRKALQQALKLHHSTLDGRILNIELTAGGGGKSEGRLSKLKSRNKQLRGQRERRERDGEMTSHIADKPKRFSTTSGEEQTNSKPKTWTVEDVDDGRTHRGGQRRSKKSKNRSRGTGVNAIPIN